MIEPCPPWCQRPGCRPRGGIRVHKARFTQIEDGDTLAYATLLRFDADPTDRRLFVEVWFTERSGEGRDFPATGHAAWLTIPGAQRLHEQIGEQLALAAGGAS